MNLSDSKIISIFEQVEDSRSHVNRLHNLIDILLIGIISVICGAETWKQMVAFAKSKEAFLKTFLELPQGIPSEHTINKVFSYVDSVQFERCFLESVRAFRDNDIKTKKATRYYISNLKRRANDVTFSGGISKKRGGNKRTGNAAQNYSILLKIALNLLINEKTEKEAVQAKRLKAARDNQYLLKVLRIKV